MVYTHVSLEAAAFYTARRSTPNILRSICQSDAIATQVYPLRVVPVVALLGCAMVICGGYIRQLCYRALGDMFTWELSVKKTHRLVTSGPYAYVRHPAYTGKYLAELGLLILFTSPHTLARECLWKNYPFFTLADIGSCLTIHFGVSIWLAHRTSDEDAVMKSRFGEEWRRWAEKTRYKFVPYIA
jgi:protein-S-isoprenylcysteine O-methyltransferase Ste14